MVFKNHNRLELDYDRFPGGIFNPSLVQHDGILWGMARCEQHNQAERNEDKSLNFTPTLAVLFKLNASLELLVLFRVLIHILIIIILFIMILKVVF